VTSIKADGGGERKDAGKSRVDLFPPDALLEVGHVFRMGATKYSDRNWERGMPWSKCLGPLMRHLFKWMMGEKLDEESGHHHLAHVCFNALALLAYDMRQIGKDDRNNLTKPGE